MTLTVIILTYNESLHIARCLDSVQSLDCKTVVVDSFSQDATEEIVGKYAVDFYKNTFVNQSKQLNWALRNCNIDSEWVLRLDADEYLSKELADEIRIKLASLGSDVDGVLIKRKVIFMDRWIRWGGYYPIWILRLWRVGKGVVENKHMDEKIRVPSNGIAKFKEDIIENNLNSLSWWVDKHNGYASREVAEILSQQNTSTNGDYRRKDAQDSNQWYKYNLYYKLPIFLRAFLYFLYRYFFKLGFLDGKAGLVWHTLQGFWYRFLIDSKYLESKIKDR